MEQNKLREELKHILENEPENYSKILKLSSELSKFDQDSVRFSIDAGIIDRLGKELVARHETAVSELVKNAYDADAKKVKLTFIDSSEIGGIIVINDDGVGMTKEQLVNGFMRLASSDKIHFPFKGEVVNLVAIDAQVDMIIVDLKIYDESYFEKVRRVYSERQQVISDFIKNAKGL